SDLRGGPAGLGRTAVLRGQRVTDLGEQHDVLGDGGLLLLGQAAALAVELARGGDRQHEHEVDDGRGDQERDHGGEDGADVDERSVIALDDLEGEAVDVVAAEDVDHRLDQVVDEGSDQSGEGSADNDADGEVDDVALHDEV